LAFILAFVFVFHVYPNFWMRDCLIWNWRWWNQRW